jgi:hypothetical protein
VGFVLCFAYAIGWLRGRWQLADWLRREQRLLLVVVAGARIGAVVGRPRDDVAHGPAAGRNHGGRSLHRLLLRALIMTILIATYLIC